MSSGVIMGLSSRFALAGSSRQRLVRSLPLACALLAGVAVRLASVLGHTFPLNDGGLFYLMIEELQRSGFRLPDFTSYNAAHIPYAYPPLGFYLAGLLGAIGGWDVLSLLLYLPLAISILTLVAFWRLSHTLLASRTAAVGALFAFAFLPRSGRWLLMGGGLPRGLGFLFAILALEQGYRLYTTRRGRYVPTVTLLCAGTVLSHLDMALLLVISLGLLFLFYGRNRLGLWHSALVVLGTALVSAPWWGVVVARHGVGPFLAAWQTPLTPLSGLSLSLLLRITEEPYLPLLACLALLGLGVSLWHRRLPLPLWFVAILILQPGGSPTNVTIVEALLAGVAIGELLLPLLQRLGGRLAAAGDGAGVARNAPAAGVLGLLLVLGLVSAVAAGQRLAELSRGEREAMQWIAEYTPAPSAFVLITWDNWCDDRSSEWFPALTGRISVATVQGYEWLPERAFARQMVRHEEAQRCADRDAACLEKWAATVGVAFTHVYIPKGRWLGPGKDAFARLRESLSAEAHYAIVYDGPGATIFARQPAP